MRLLSKANFVRSIVVMTLALAMAYLAAGTQAADDGWIKLFNGKDFTGWRKYFPPDAKNADPDKIWTVKDGVIVCLGKPAGYIITDKDYDNYELEFQWRWNPAAKPGNSGCFVHVVGKDGIWPKAVEAQLMADHAGDFWLVDGAQLEIDPARQDKDTARHYYRTTDNVEKPVGEWNQYRIVCDGDTITLYINGKEVNKGTKSELTKGKILLQSEGAEIHFRDIKLKPLK